MKKVNLMNNNQETKKSMEFQMKEYKVDADILEDPVAPGWGVYCTGKACTSKSWGVVCG